MLNTCGKEGCCPVEQIRGEIGPGEHYDVIANNRVERFGGVPEPEKYGIIIWPTVAGNFDCGENRPEHCVEMTDAMKDSFRICCKTCGKATPWGAQDIPGMPGAGADWTRKNWNDKTAAA